MVEKVKNLNWHLYSDIGLMLANISAILSIFMLTMNTKVLATNEILVYYTILGLMCLVLLKLNHEAGSES